MSITSIIFSSVKIVLISVIAVFCLYNAAAFFNLIPEKFSAVQMYKENYIRAKAIVTEASYVDDFTGRSAKYILGKMNDVEQYYAAEEAYEVEQNAIAEKCNENKGMRKIMMLGESDEKKQECYEKDDPISKAKEAVDSLEKQQQQQTEMLDSL